MDEGGSIELDTHVTGVPLPEITWKKNGVSLESGGRITFGYDSDKVRYPFGRACTYIRRWVAGGV